MRHKPLSVSLLVEWCLPFFLPTSLLTCAQFFFYTCIPDPVPPHLILSYLKLFCLATLMVNNSIQWSWEVLWLKYFQFDDFVTFSHPSKSITQVIIDLIFFPHRFIDFFLCHTIYGAISSFVSNTLLPLRLLKIHSIDLKKFSVVLKHLLSRVLFPSIPLSFPKTIVSLLCLFFSCP